MCALRPPRSRAPVAPLLVALLLLGSARAAVDHPAASVEVGAVLGDASAATPGGPRLDLAVLTAQDVCALPERAAPGAAPGSPQAFLLEPPAAGDDTCWIAGLVALGGGATAGTYVLAEGSDESPSEFAFRVKRAAVTLRAADPAAVVVAGPFVTGDDGRVEAFAEGDPGPYLDALAAVPAEIATAATERNRLFPGLQLWSVERDAAPGDAALLRAARALRAGADLAVVRADEAGRGELARFNAALPPAARVSFSTTVQTYAGDVEPALELIGADGVRLVVVPPHERALSLRVGSPPAQRAERIVAADGASADAALRVQPDGSSLVRLAPAPGVELLRVEARADVIAEREDVQRDRPGLTAAEIIARERQRRARQELALHDFQARARMAYHFTLANFGESIDVVSENDAFGRGDAMQYRQTALYVNGTLWKGKPPAFPFVAPDRVTDVPLEITLHEGYRYVLDGEERQNGHDCYRIRFEPDSESAALRGTVWIDRETFFRVRLDLVRLAPTPPVTSDVLTQWFEPIDTAEGTFWLPTRMEGQMVFSALSHNAVVERKVTFTDIRVNPPRFEQELAAALSSDDPMFRDSLAGGLVKLVPGETEGQRTAQSASQTANTLLVGGWGASISGSLGSPFAAINWFDMDYKGTGKQLDVAWAGLFAAVSVTFPELPSRWEVSTSTTAFGIERTDRYADETGRVTAQDLKRLDETVDFHFRRPLGPMLTFALNPRLAYLRVSRDSDTVKEYVLPPDAIVGTLGLRLDFQRKGYKLGFWTEAERRSDWGPYGLDTTSPAFTDPQKTALRWGVQFNKNVYVHRLDRLSCSVDFVDGRNLDRFSSFRTSGLDDVDVRGFSSSGLRFTRGMTGDLGYAFGLGVKARMEISLGGAWFRSPEDFGTDWQYAVGTTVGVSFPGPRGTLFRVRISRGIDSSLPIEGSRGSLRFYVFKTFDGWWPRDRKGRRRALRSE